MICRATYELFRSAHVPHMYYLADLFDRRTETLYADFAHLGPEGNRLVAEDIFDIIQNKDPVSLSSAKPPIKPSLQMAVANK